MRLPAVLTRNWPLKLTSLFLAVVLWLMAAGEEPASRLVTAEVRVRAPEGRDIVRPPGTVAVSVVGPARELLKLSATRLIITKILPDTISEDQAVLLLAPGDVELPKDVDAVVQDLQPRSMTVVLDDVDAREVPVAVRLAAGERAAGELVSDPPTVRLVGPASALGDFDSASTAPVTAAELRAPFGHQVRIDTAGMGPVRSVPRRVTVSTSGEPAVERELGQVPLQLHAAIAAGFTSSHDAVTVRLSGQAARVAALQPADVVVVLDGTPPPEGGALPVRVIAPAGVTATAAPDQVELTPRAP
ncbi:MAG TPA: hypothetical protein VD813_08830 [Pseudonocardia sp.]|nr:hypothetical protein [Pseudonocardia sp.]